MVLVCTRCTVFQINYLIFQQFFFFFFSHNTTYPKYNKTKQQTHTQHLKVQSKGRERGKDNKNKSHSPIQSRTSIKKHCQASMVEGLAPPTRAVVHSHDTICRRLRIQYVFLHMCGVNQFWIIVFFATVKPANNILFCIELILRPGARFNKEVQPTQSLNLNSRVDLRRSHQAQ